MNGQNNIALAVRHMDGWCAKADEPDLDFPKHTKTLCGCIIQSPMAVAIHRVTCEECIKKLHERPAPKVKEVKVENRQEAPGARYGFRLAL